MSPKASKAKTKPAATKAAKNSPAKKGKEKPAAPKTDGRANSGRRTQYPEGVAINKTRTKELVKSFKALEVRQTKIAVARHGVENDVNNAGVAALILACLDIEISENDALALRRSVFREIDKKENPPAKTEAAPKATKAKVAKGKAAPEPAETGELNKKEQKAAKKAAKVARKAEKLAELQAKEKALKAAKKANKKKGKKSKA